MDYSVEQELKKIWRALRCKADCNYSGLTFNNGLTRTANNVQLGGDVIQDTILAFDPNENYIAFGDVNGGVFGFGDLTVIGLNQNTFAALNLDMYLGVNQFNVVTENSTIRTTQVNTLEANSYDGDDATISLRAKDSVSALETNVYFGVYNATDKLAGAISASVIKTQPNNLADINMYIFNDNIGLDVVRMALQLNQIHGRVFDDYTDANSTYTGWHCEADEYAQLEFRKTGEDAQTSGTCWTIDADGASLFVGGVKQFRIKNSVPSYADDAAAVGGGLATGDVYKTTTGGSTFLKIVP
jgi:hypothetical protein